MAQAALNALNKGIKKSVACRARYDKIYEIERAKWPEDLREKSRSELSKKMNKKLDEYIEKTQKIAREACQTEELTEAYLKGKN